MITNALRRKIRSRIVTTATMVPLTISNKALRLNSVGEMLHSVGGGPPGLNPEINSVKAMVVVTQ